MQQPRRHFDAWASWLPWLLLALLGGWLLSLLAPILTPFMIAAALAYLGDPLVDRLQQQRLSRSFAVIVVFVLMTLIMVAMVLILLPLLETQINYLLQRIPDYWNWIADVVLPWINQGIGMQLSIPDGGEIFNLLREHWQSAGSFAAMLVSAVTQSGMAVIGWLINLTLIPVVTFYFLRDWDHFISNLRSLLPRAAEPVIVGLAAAANSVLSAFIRGQLLVMLALAMIYSIGLALIGIKLALLIGLLAGVLSIVPYLGTVIGITAALIAVAVQFGDWLHLLLVVAVFMLGQMLEGMVLTPWLVGDRIGLHPVAVIFAVMSGGILFGFTGVLLALPVAAVAMVLLRYAHERYTSSYLYQGNTQTPESGPELDQAPGHDEGRDTGRDSSHSSAAANLPGSQTPASAASGKADASQDQGVTGTAETGDEPRKD